MEDAQLKELFGMQLVDAVQVMFQHTDRITPEATFAHKNMRVMLSSEARGEPIPYRKGQVHPSVYMEVCQGALRCASVPLMSREACVIATGGTPDGVVGALAAGYRHVIVVSNHAAEKRMLELPTKAEQEKHKLDWSRRLGIN